MSTFGPIRRLSVEVFFYRRSFLLRHFVGESEARITAVNIGDGMTILREMIGRTAILQGI
jgi:hypothetical protein